jgi:hypothetical protein
LRATYFARNSEGKVKSKRSLKIEDGKRQAAVE